MSESSKREPSSAVWFEKVVKTRHQRQADRHLLGHERRGREYCKEYLAPRSDTTRVDVERQQVEHQKQHVMTGCDIRNGFGMEWNDGPERRDSQSERFVIPEPSPGKSEDEQRREQVENQVGQMEATGAVPPDLTVDPEGQERERAII